MARLEPAVAGGSLLAYYQALWAPYYAAVKNILGPTGTILAFGDPHHGQPNAGTFKTIGAEQVTFTWSEAPASFDTPLDLRLESNFEGIIPVVTFNGTDEEADSPDAAYWSRGDGSNDSPFSMGVWIRAATLSGADTLLSKWDDSSGEWRWHLAAGQPKFFITDAGAAEVNRVQDAAITVGVWTFLAVTYDGAGGVSAMDTVALYEDGVSQAATSTNSGSYVATDDQTDIVRLGFEGSTPANFFDGKMAGGPLGPFFTQVVLTADQVLELYRLGAGAMAL